MKKEKKYTNVNFSADHIQEAIQEWSKLFLNEKHEKIGSDLQITKGSEIWDYDSDQEFFADYRRGFSRATIHKMTYTKDRYFDINVRVIAESHISFSEVGINSKTRSEIESVFNVFEKYLPDATLPPKPPEKIPSPIIFIGHGRNQQWRDLKDHLHDKHGYEIEAYEIGARAGHSIRDILERMLKKSSFSFLVMTGEDEDAAGKLHARENVIHETGLFQGRLGFDRAIILLEDGTEEFSNIHGIHQIRFSKNNIKECYGEVLATLRREFGLNRE
jgi:predicted nucleotide-binding protein